MTIVILIKLQQVLQFSAIWLSRHNFFDVLFITYFLQPLHWYSFKACKLKQWKGGLSSDINVELFTNYETLAFLRKKILLKKKPLKRGGGHFEELS